MATSTKAGDIDMIEIANQKKDQDENVSRVDPDVQKSLLRKLDYRMMPVFFVMYFLNHWDRNGLPQAKLNGIKEDLGLVGNQYNVCISILYVGYLIAGVPSNMILTRVRPSIYLGVCIYPGAIYLLSRFYTKREVSTRLAILYCGQLSSSSFSGLLTAAIFASLDGKYGLRGWQWLFIIEGCATFAFATIAIFLLPDTPGKTAWMSTLENECAVIRLQEDSITQLEHQSPIQGFKSAITDYKVWLFMIMQNMHFCAMSFNQFFPTIVKTLEYNSIITLVLTCPPYLLSAVFALALARSSGDFNERTWHIVGGNVVAMVGFIIACVTHTTAPRYFACFLFAAGSYSTGSIILGWAAANIVDSHEKKAVTLALINYSAVAANIYTAYLWPDSDGPQFLMGLSSSVAFSFLCGTVAIVACYVFRGENRKHFSHTESDDVKLFVT